MKKYKIKKNIKVIDIYETDLSKKHLKDGENVLFKGMHCFNFRYARVVRDDFNNQYIFEYCDGCAKIPYYEEVKKCIKERIK
jgi:hypothetical protein